jgi:hypothetical protein
VIWYEVHVQSLQIPERTEENYDKSQDSPCLNTGQLPNTAWKCLRVLEPTCWVVGNRAIHNAEIACFKTHAVGMSGLYVWTFCLYDRQICLGILSVWLADMSWQSVELANISVQFICMTGWYACVMCLKDWLICVGSASALLANVSGQAGWYLSWRSVGPTSIGMTGWKNTEANSSFLS